MPGWADSTMRSSNFTASASHPTPSAEAVLHGGPASAALRNSYPAPLSIGRSWSPRLGSGLFNPPRRQVPCALCVAAAQPEDNPSTVRAQAHEGDTIVDPRKADRSILRWIADSTLEGNKGEQGGNKGNMHSRARGLSNPPPQSGPSGCGYDLSRSET